MIGARFLSAGSIWRRQCSWLLVGCFMFLLPTALLAAAPSARELLDSGHADEALRILTPLATGNDAAAYNYLGRVYFELRDWDNAVRYCERATQLAPNNAEFQLWLGRSYGEKADSAGPLTAYSLARKSVAAFETAHALDRHSLAIARDLAEYYGTAPSIVGGGTTRALALAAEIAPEYPSTAAWIRAMVASHDGDNEQAEREYEQSIRLDHDSAAANLEYTRYLKGRKDWKGFDQTMERALRSPRIRPVDRFDAAERLLKADRNLAEAARQVRGYIQSGHPEEDAPLFRAHLVLGDILVKTGDTEQAAAEYRAALALASSYRPAVDALRRLGKR